MLDESQLDGFVKVRFTNRFYEKTYVYGVPSGMYKEDNFLEDFVVVPNGLYASDPTKHKPYTIGYAVDWIDLDSDAGQSISYSMNTITMIAGYVYANTYQSYDVWHSNNLDDMWDDMSRTEREDFVRKVLQKSLDL